ncbi:MAG: Glu-tRNA(Gln) amidotransferase GatDE subunit E [Candidatus Tectomicrobia bacterium]|uniref:Glu-tRNA(Gln) amidotransferase GatDE subunit E n=1 Tax=Tectimicrobiota bacterium TaxID=2528274 RepID=A0A932HWK4_UNCTE|nr:Glu-tRNA(Gln) amidotransferase GatDE subunit E [Candidatus Tectomicrobia bacterium]
MPKLDYEALGFRSGLEVHYQLLTDRKLFCSCPAGRYSTRFDAEILRHMRPTLSELGEYDGTALMEFKTRKEVVYQIRNDSVCTYEMDDTPPFPPDPHAVDTALEVALLLGCSVVGEIHITRKQYLDGSIPTGFQRTAIVGVEGKIVLFSGQELPVVQVSFEEDSCREVKDEGHRIVFRTDRLGMPLVEVVTYPEMRSPREVAEAGRRIGQLLRSTGKVRRGLGSVRQDVNVSIEGAPRIEIKGVPRLQAFERLTHNEALRQKGLLEIRERLRGRGLSADKLNVTSVPAPPESLDHPVLQKALGQGKKARVVRIAGFGDVMAWPLQEDPRGEEVPFLRELTGRVRVIACLDAPPILFCREAHDPRHPERLGGPCWEAAARAAGAAPGDALLIAWGTDGDLDTAVQEIAIRCREAAEGIPQETRQALKDGTTDFERILPGPDRMYPDTDLPLIPVEEERLARLEAELPVTPWRWEEDFRAWKIPEDAIEALVDSPRAHLLDRIVRETGAPPVLAATALTRDAKALGRRKIDLGRLGEDRWVDLFRSLQAGTFGREAIPVLLEALAASPGLTAAQAAEQAGLRVLADSELGEIVDEAIAAHGEDPMHNPGEANRLRYLMGLLMKRVRGKRDGNEILALLQKRWKASRPSA